MSAFFQDFAPQVRRVTPLGPKSKRLTISPIAYLHPLPSKDLAPGVKPTQQYFDPLSPLDPDWPSRAACLGKGSTPEGIAMWFPGPGGSQRGKIYCLVCSVRRECGNYADENGIEWGIWGGEIRHRNPNSQKEEAA